MVKEMPVLDMKENLESILSINRETCCFDVSENKLPPLYSRCLQSAENADPQFHLEYRGPITMKGKKEPMKVWFLSRNPTDSESTIVKA